MTIHRITEAAHADLTGGLAAFVQVDTHLGLVGQVTDPSGQWSLTPVDVTSSSVSAGTAWTPATPPLPWLGLISSQWLAALGAGRAVYMRTWVDVSSSPAHGEWTELFVLTTDGSTVTVDSDTNLNTDLGLPGQAFSLNKTAALAVLVGMEDSSTVPAVTSFHRVDVSSGSIAMSAAVGAGGGIFVADDYTVAVGSGSVSAFDGTGAVITTLSQPVASPTYLPFTSNTGAIVGSTMSGPPGYALITLNPLSISASGGPITFGAPVLFDGPAGTIGVDFAQVTGSPSTAGWYFWPDELDFSFLYPPGDEPWNTAPDGVRRSAIFPDIFAFSHAPLFGWDHADFNDRPHAYVDGTLGNYINKGGQLFWHQGVGDNTVVVAYTDGSDTTVAVFAAGVLAPPTAHLTVTPSSGTGSLLVTADATASTAPVPTLLESAGFDFGAGMIGPGPTFTATHFYHPSVTTTFTVSVTVYDFFQQSGTATATVHVTVIPPFVPPLRQRQRPTGTGAAAGAPLRQRGTFGDSAPPLRQRGAL